MQVQVDVRFCSLCDESVPQTEFEAGRALECDGRVVCASCDLAMSAFRPKPIEPRSIAGVASPAPRTNPRRRPEPRPRRAAPARPPLGLFAIVMSQLLVFAVFAAVVAVVLIAVRQRYGWSVDAFLDQVIERLN